MLKRIRIIVLFFLCRDLEHPLHQCAGFVEGHCGDPAHHIEDASALDQDALPRRGPDAPEVPQRLTRSEEVV